MYDIEEVVNDVQEEQMTPTVPIVILPPTTMDAHNSFGLTTQWSVFKTPIDVNILYRLLDGISTKYDKYYVIDANSFRLLQFYYDTLYKEFIEALTPHYHVSKRYYLTRPLTYNSFTTIVRHICNAYDITITRKPTYTKSMYSVSYYVQRIVIPDGRSI